MYQKMPLPAKKQMNQGDAARNFKSSTQLQSVYQSITPNSNARAVPRDILGEKELKQVNYGANFEPMTIGGTSANREGPMLTDSQSMPDILRNSNSKL
jgi:hypothetical protein